MQSKISLSKKLKTKNMTTLHLKKSIGRSPLRHALLFIPLLFTCVLLPPSVKAGQCIVSNSCGPGTFCYTTHENILGDYGGFHDNTSAGCLALYNAQTTSCGDDRGPCATIYSGPVMHYDTAFGSHALFNNGSGDYNSAIGAYSLYSNTNGTFNTAVGFEALRLNTTGTQNTANGVYALYHNTGGSYNTADGFNALQHNTGSDNIGLGSTAGFNLTTGSGNVCIGQGVLGVAGESNTTRIRNVYASVASVRAVYVNSDNKMGTLASTRRVKENIKPMDKASEAILALKPVSFRYKKEIDASRTPQFGLIAEDVADINPDLVTRDGEGKPETVRYDSINAMLLNEFLKEHHTVQEQKATISQLKSTVAQQQKDFQTTAAHQQKQIEALTAGLQKVSARLEASKSAPQVVNNP